MSIERRIERAERALTIGQEPIVITVTNFSGKRLPPEQRRDNLIIRHVAYESGREHPKGEAEHAY
jgi:hypothetical protein